MIDRFIEERQQKSGDPIWIAMIYAGLEEYDQVFEWLDLALEERAANIIYLRDCMPQFDQVCKDPRWNDFLKRTGLIN